MQSSSCPWQEINIIVLVLSALSNRVGQPIYNCKMEVRLVLLIQRWSIPERTHYSSLCFILLDLFVDKTTLGFPIHSPLLPSELRVYRRYNPVFIIINTVGGFHTCVRTKNSQWLAKYIAWQFNSRLGSRFKFKYSSRTHALWTTTALDSTLSKPS